jgi:hypothetical protein
MSGYDHELTLGLTLFKFVYKPGVSCLIQTASRVRAVYGVGISLAGVIERYNLDRDV